MYVAKSLPRLQDTNELSGLNDMMDSSPFDTETASGGNDLSPIPLNEVLAIMKKQPIKSMFKFKDHHEI